MAVTVDPKSNKLIIRFRVKGYSKQFYLSTGLKDTKPNRAIVETRWELIQREIALDEFDPTLERYRFGNKKKVEVKKLSIKSLPELWEDYTIYKSQIIEKTTIGGYESIGRIIKELPHNPVDIRDFLLSNHSYSRAKKIFDALSNCMDWAVQSGLISENKFKTLKLPHRKKSSTDRIACYTLDQRDLIIYSFETHSRFNYCANLVKFLFWTGCRPGEAFALIWGDISEDCTKINFSKSYASHERIVKGTKNGKSRIFPVAPGGKLQNLLIEMKCDRTTDLVFTGSHGQRMKLGILDNAWRGRRTGKYFYPGVVFDLAEQGKLPLLSPYSTRHTFATWAIASGCTPDKVAYWLGDNVGTVLSFYCHPEISKSDCPDF